MEEDVFTPVFKNFRRLDESRCVDEAFSVCKNPSEFERREIRCDSENLDEKSVGLRPISDWSMFECCFSRGLFIIPNPFTRDGMKFWIERSVNEFARQNRTSVGENGSNENLSRLRWATLGFHYDWTNKVYDRNDFTELPADLKKLFCIVSSVFSSSTACSVMRPQAVIVNYYHMNSTLCAHTDHSEFECLDKYLLSFSFGNSSVFLIGDRTKTSRPPSPILLRSGDILIMSGESRLCFHAVPRILHDPMVNDFIDETDDENIRVALNYIRDKRININVRQVFNESN